jgi:hypothetical protein
MALLELVRHRAARDAGTQAAKCAFRYEPRHEKTWKKTS